MSLNVDEAMEIIRHHKRVAIVGLSPKEDRPSFRVGQFLLEKGFTVIPVNPVHKEIMGRPSVASLAELDPDSIDWVDFFVAPGRLPDFGNDIIRLSPKLVWCQLGVVNPDFNERLENAQIPFISDACPKIEWKES
jgi:predicted CoA-binding protein